MGNEREEENETRDQTAMSDAGRYMVAMNVNAFTVTAFFCPILFSRSISCATFFMACSVS